MSRESNPGNRRTKSKSVTVKAAWIGGGCLIAAAIIGPVVAAVLNGHSVAPVPSVSTSNAPSYLGADLLAQWCVLHDQGSATLSPPGIYTPNAIYHWECTNGYRITRQDMTKACQLAYGANAQALCYDPNNAYSCKCYT